MADILYSKQSGLDESPAPTVTSTMTRTQTALSDLGRTNSPSKPQGFMETSKLARIIKTTATKGCQLSGGLRCLIAKHGGRIVTTSRIMAAMGGFIVACIALWSAICAMEDSRKAVRLAEWTAKKDFLEFCQTMQYQDTGCEDTKAKSLGPPPTAWIKARMYRRAIGEHGSSHGSIMIFLGFPLAAILWALFRKRLRRIIRRQLRFNITSRTQRLQQRAMKRNRAPPPITFGSGMGTAFKFDVAFSKEKLDFGNSTSLERLSAEEMARRKRKRSLQSPAGSAPVISFNLSQSKQLRHLYDCLVCSLKFKTTEELNDHSRTHIPVYCWQCDLMGINHDGKTVVDTPGSMSCLANPVFCHYCGDSFARWRTEVSEPEVMEGVRLRRNNSGRYSVPLETAHTLGPTRGAESLKAINPLNRFRTSVPPRRSALLDIVDGIEMPT